MPKLWIKKTVEKEWAQKNYSITFFMHCIAGLMPIHWLKNHKSGRKNWTQKISTEMPRKWVNRRCEQEQKKIAHKWTHTQHQWDGIREPTNVQKKKNYSYARHHSASIFFLASKSLLFLSLLNTRSLLPRALSLFTFQLLQRIHFDILFNSIFQFLSATHKYCGFTAYFTSSAHFRIWPNALFP